MNTVVLLHLFTFILTAIEPGAPCNYKSNAELEIDRTTVDDAIKREHIIILTKGQ